MCAVHIDARGKYIGKCDAERTAYGNGSVMARATVKSSAESTSSFSPESAPLEPSAAASASASALASAGTQTPRPESDWRANGHQHSTNTFSSAAAAEPLNGAIASGFTGSTSSSVARAGDSDAVRNRLHFDVAGNAPPSSLHHRTIGGDTLSQSHFDASAQKLRKLPDPRELQEASRTLVTHVLRVERSREPPFTLQVSTIISCDPYVRIYTIASFSKELPLIG